jgi:drug/metabolite transporter (DMT)-like permease
MALNQGRILILVPIWYWCSSLFVVCLKASNEPTPSMEIVLLDETLIQLLCGAFVTYTYLSVTRCWSESSSGPGPENVAFFDFDTTLRRCTISNCIISTSFHIVGTMATNWAVFELGASKSQIMKLLEPLATICFAYIILNEMTSLMAICGIVLTCVGVFILVPQLDSDTDTFLSNHYRYFVGSFLLATAYPLRNVYSKRLKTDGAHTYYDICLTGFILTIIVKFLYDTFSYSFYKIAILYKFSGSNILNELYLYPIKWINMGLASVGHNIFSYIILTEVTTVTHSLLRLVKRFVTIVLTFILLNDLDLKRNTILGLFLCFLGLIIYWTTINLCNKNQTNRKLIVHTPTPLISGNAQELEYERGNNSKASIAFMLGNIFMILICSIIMS